MAETAYYEHWSEYPMHLWDWPDFTPEEIASRTVVNGGRGPKGPLLLNFDALDKLQELRSLIGKPFHVNSAYRSPEYNRFVGGASRSKHMEGIAFDISMHNQNRTEFVRLVRQFGFNGIGHYGTFTHIDTRPNQAEWWG
jgi:hypothetical protein